MVRHGECDAWCLLPASAVSSTICISPRRAMHWNRTCAVPVSGVFSALFHTSHGKESGKCTNHFGNPIWTSLSLQKQLLAESDPVLLAGDFNTPPMGPIHSQLTKGLQDSHIAAGSGFGFTFPGDTHNPLSLFQPWLRLDRIHFSKHWQALHCSTFDMPAQHLPVIAELQLLPSSHK